MARFNFKVLYHAATIRGRLDFEGSIYRDRHVRVYTASIISLFVCMYMCVCAYVNRWWPRTMRWNFEGSVYWDELAEICGKIWRAAGFQGAARFRGNMVYVSTPHAWVTNKNVWLHSIPLPCACTRGKMSGSVVVIVMAVCHCPHKNCQI